MEEIVTDMTLVKTQTFQNYKQDIWFVLLTNNILKLKYFLPKYLQFKYCLPKYFQANVMITFTNISTPNISRQKNLCYKIYYKNIPCQNISDKNISGQNISDRNISGHNILGKNISYQSIFYQNISYQNIS
jgi:hypothetical protein